MYREFQNGRDKNVVPLFLSSSLLRSRFLEVLGKVKAQTG